MSVLTTQDALVRLTMLKDIAKKAQDLVAQAEKSLIDAMAREHKDQVTAVTADGDEVKGTLVAPQRVSIDAEAIHKVVPAKTWNKITKQVLDTALLEAAVAMGEVDAQVVADASTVKDTKPYVKITGSFPKSAITPVNEAVEVSITNAKGSLKPAVRRRVAKPRAVK